MTRIVLDTDVVSLYRMGRLSEAYVRLMTASRHCIAFATAGERWKGRWTSDGTVPVAARSTYGWPGR